MALPQHLQQGNYAGPTNLPGKPVEQHYSDFAQQVSTNSPLYDFAYQRGSQKQNLASLFSSLNDISMKDPRAGGGGKGGGTTPTEGNMEGNPLVLT